MSDSPPPPPRLAALTPTAQSKARKGLARLYHAGINSVCGLRAAWLEAAFRLEVCLALVLIPCAFWVGRHWSEVALLIAVTLLVLIVELLNTGIEAVVDRVGVEWHAESKRAKDVGSAAVLLAMLLAVGVWAAALYQRLG